MKMVPSNLKSQDSKWSKASKEETIDSLPENVKSIARNLRIAVDQMHLGLTKAKELILETARQLDEEHVEEQDKICKKIKEILKDKIQEGKISEGWIEECLPREYKRKYTRTESQQNRLSGVQQPELLVSTQGNQISQSDTDSKVPDRSTRTGTNSEANQSGFGDEEQDRTTNTGSKEESTRMLPLNDEPTSAIKQNEDLMDTKKKVLISHITMTLEHLRRDMYAVSQRTNGMGNIFWKLSIDLATRVAKIEFCGITQEKDVTMISTGKGILR
jgi:hypothetical protein